jgi:uncharacterized protein (DUF58 family)
MSRRKIIIAASLLVILGLGLVGGSVLLLRLFFLSVLIIVLSYLWATLSLRHLSVRTAEPPEHLQVGDTFQREAIISNPGRLPRLWLRIQDDTDLPGHRDTAIISIMSRSSYGWPAGFTCRQRGRYHLGPVTLTAADPLGIFNSRRTLGEAREITAYPATVDLPRFKFASFSDFGSGAGYRTISYVSPNASSIREFASGDSLRHIHWRSTARMGKLMVKVFDADRSDNASKTAWLLLDMNQEAHFGHGKEASQEYAITIAASLAKKYLQSGRQVGMLASGERPSLIIPERGEEQLWGIMKALALMQADGKLTLGEAASPHLNSLRDNPLVIVIATSASENLTEVIHQLRNRVDSVVVILLDAASFGGHSSSTGISQTLTRSGTQVYTIRQGTELARALDSKATRLYPQLV